MAIEWEAPENFDNYNDTDISVLADEMLAEGGKTNDNLGDQSVSGVPDPVAPPAGVPAAKTGEVPVAKEPLDLASIARMRAAARENRTKNPPKKEPDSQKQIDPEQIKADILAEFKKSQQNHTGETIEHIIAQFEADPKTWYEKRGRDPAKVVQGWVEATSDHKAKAPVREIDELKNKIAKLEQDAKDKDARAQADSQSWQERQSRMQAAEAEKAARSQFMQIARGKIDPANDNSENKYDLLATLDEEVLDMLATASAVSLTRLKEDLGEEARFSFDEVAEISNNTVKRILAALDRGDAGGQKNQQKTLTNGMTGSTSAFDPTTLSDDDLSELVGKMLQG